MACFKVEKCLATAKHLGWVEKNVLPFTTGFLYLWSMGMHWLLSRYAQSVRIRATVASCAPIRMGANNDARGARAGWYELSEVDRRTSRAWLPIESASIGLVGPSKANCQSYWLGWVD